MLKYFVTDFQVLQKKLRQMHATRIKLVAADATALPKIWSNSLNRFTSDRKVKAATAEAKVEGSRLLEN